MHFDDLDISTRYLLVELINFRLVRFFKTIKPDNLIRAITDILKSISTKPSTMHRLYVTVEMLIIKCFLYVLSSTEKFQEMVMFNKKFLKLIGETYPRMVGHAAIRLFKTKYVIVTFLLTLRRGVFGTVGVEKSQQVMDALVQECPHIFPLDSAANYNLSPVSFVVFPKGPDMRTHLMDVTRQLVESSHSVRQLVESTLAGQLAPKELEAKMSDIVNDLQNPEVKKAFLCQVWHVFMTMQVPFMAHSQKCIKYIVMTQLNALELSTATYRLVNFVLFEYMKEVSPEELVPKVGDLFIRFVWELEVVSLETLTLALIEQIPYHNNANLIINYILLGEHFVERVKFFMEIGLNPNQWDEDDAYPKHCIYHHRYPENWGLQDNQNAEKDTVDLPCYFGNVCLRMIPVMDLLFRKLIECAERDSLMLLVDNYGLFFSKYHENIVTFLRSVLLLNYDRTFQSREDPNMVLYSLDPTLKFKFLTLLLSDPTHLMGHISPELQVVLSNMANFGDFSDYFKIPYFISRIQYLSEVFPTINDVDIGNNSIRDHFNEYV